MTHPQVADLARMTQMQVLSLLLDTEDRARVRGTIEPRWFTDQIYRHALESALAWDAAHPEALTFPLWMHDVSARSGQTVSACALAISATLEYPGTTRSLSGYALHLRTEWERRTIGRMGLDIHERSKDQTVDPGDLAGSIRSIGDVLRARHSDIVSGADALAEEAMRSNAGVVPLGYSRLDQLLSGGIRPGDLCTVAARPGVGKTAFAVGVARHALSLGFPVGYVSLEMSAGQIEARLRAIPCQRREIQVYCPGSATPEQVLGACHKMAESGLALVVVDHAQLIHAQGRSRYEKMTEASHAMKSLARTLSVPVMLLSQLNRDAANREPELSDLKDSGAFEEDSDQVILLHRPFEQDRNKPEHEAFFALAKHRNGPTGTGRLYWTPSQASYSDWPA